jgi:thioredoxin reductase
MHNYLGREGTSPRELLAIGRAEVEQYGVQVRAGTATTAGREDDGTFVVTLADGSDGTVRARRLLVTTGLVDQLPDLPGVADGWGQSVLHCPYCHGWEVRDQAIGVLGTGPMSVHQAQLFRQLSEDVVLFHHSGPAPSAEELERLGARHIRVVDGPVAAWEADGVRLASGELHPRQVLVVGAPVRARSDFLEGLGLHAVDVEVGGQHIGTVIESDPMGLTAVPGVWVAGNVTDPKAFVIASSAAGTLAGAAINADLVTEETDVAVEMHQMLTEAAWEERYRSKEDGIWSGRPNPVLVAETDDLTPGTALDVGCGEGADALWLAARGWQVTGTDISTVALERAAAHSNSQGLAVTW